MGLVQNRGSVLAFLFVLCIMCLGAYASLSTLMRVRTGEVVALETLTPTGGGEATPVSSVPVPTETPMETPTPHTELSTPVAPTATPVPPPTATSAPRPTATPSPTPTAAGASPTSVPPVGPHQYRVIRNEVDCSSGRLIGGKVYDADDNGLPWATIKLYNDFGWSATQQSEAPPETGKYEFAMGTEAGLFHLVVVDDSGQSVSPVLDLEYLPDCSNRIDWQRVR